MTDTIDTHTIKCTLCGRDQPAEAIRWFVPYAPDAAEDRGTLVINWPETTGADPLGVPYCAGCLAEQIADESENVIG